MSQTQWIILCLKTGLISGEISLVAWVVLYSVLAAWWRNPIGRTLVAKTAPIARLFIPSILALFFRPDFYIARWADVILLGVVTPGMIWRSVVWGRLHQAGQLPKES